jgi:hypothetical protein
MVDRSLLVDAKMLAAFANLEPADVDNFRNAVAPDFVPDGFWAGMALSIVPGATSSRIWQVEQKRLREAWRSQFSPERCLDLIVSAAKLSESEQRRQQIAERMLKMDNDAALEFAAEQDVPKPKIYPYQHAVMLLALQPWRARICGKCAKHFMKDKPRDRYCSKACSKQAVLDSKSNSWSKHGKDWRPSKPPKKSRKSGGR